MKLLKSFFIAISLYSKIPVPGFMWKKEDMQYSFIFFPWIGAIIGGLMYLWSFICESFGIWDLPRILILCAIPLLVTGGFHVDGYMDTMDALKSYKPREEKLEILKDPHIGAFSVIMLAVYGLIFVSGVSLLEKPAVFIFFMGFFISRCLSGFAAVTVKCAKNDGILFQFSESAGHAPVIVKSFLVIQFIVCAGLMIWVYPVAGVVAVLGALLTYGYYIYKCKKEFNGITGDTAGWFVCLCEAVMVVLCGICSVSGL